MSDLETTSQPKPLDPQVNPDPAQAQLRSPLRAMLWLLLLFGALIAFGALYE